MSEKCCNNNINKHNNNNNNSDNPLTFRRTDGGKHGEGKGMSGGAKKSLRNARTRSHTYMNVSYATYCVHIRTYGLANFDRNS